jgi:hypothetical protein
MKSETKMIRVLMLRTALGSSDGYSVHSYTKGEEFDLPEGLALSFIADKAAEEVKAEKVKADKPPKNKAEKVEANKED